MKIQTLTVVVGTQACNARCPFCVSQMTGFGELPATQGINIRNILKAIKLAKIGGVTTVLLTGKGEPTLYPDQIDAFLAELGQEFPVIELQTNGLEIGRLAQRHLDPGHRDIPQKGRLTQGMLQGWYRAGLDTIALSVVDIYAEQNRAVYHKDYPDLATTVAYLHRQGFSIRLCVMLTKEGVGSPEDLEEVVGWCRDNKVEQLTVRPIRKPERAANTQVSDYVEEHGLDEGIIDETLGWVQEHGTLVLRLMHGAEVYDVAGQNVCISDCLTLNPDMEQIRQIIFYADGRITYDWQHRGAVFLGGSVGSEGI